MVNRMHLGGLRRGRTLMLSTLLALVLAVMTSVAYGGQALAHGTVGEALGPEGDAILEDMTQGGAPPWTKA